MWGRSSRADRTYSRAKSIVSGWLTTLARSNSASARPSSAVWISAAGGSVGLRASTDSPSSLPVFSLIKRDGFVGAAMALVEIGDRVGQPPVELAGSIESLLEVVFRRVRVSGKVVEKTELIKFERCKAVEPVELAQRRIGTGEVAHPHSGPCARHRAEEAMQAICRQGFGSRQRTGLVAHLDPVDQQNELGDCIRRIEPESLLGERTRSIEAALARLHQKGAGNQLRRFGIGFERILEPRRRRRVVAPFLGMATG